MAKNSYVGIDIGYDQMKLAWVAGGEVKKTVAVQMPERLIRDGKIISIETMAEMIRTALKANGIREKKAALVLPAENVFIRNINMPVMTAEQLMYNLPYEFRDYITDELSRYKFDYAMYSTPDEIQKAMLPDEMSDAPGEEKEAASMDLLGAAVEMDYLEEMKEMLRKAGLHAEVIAPFPSAYINLIRHHVGNLPAEEVRDYCILDMGYKTIRMHIFTGDRYSVTRELEMGLQQLDEAVSQEYNVDIHLAHTYVMTNHDDCQNSESCIEVFNTIAVELMRALNFYQFSNPNSQLAGIWVGGGGANIQPLINALREMITDFEIRFIETLLPRSAEPQTDISAMPQAIGIALQ